MRRKKQILVAAEPPVYRARTYADHLHDWENARPLIAAGRELLVPDEFGTFSFSELAVFFHKHGSVLLDAAENLLDASAFKDSAALRRQTEIVQRLGALTTEPAPQATSPSVANPENGGGV